MMNTSDVRRFLLAAQAGGFTAYGRLDHDDDLELAVAAYSVGLQRIDITVADLLDILVDAGRRDLPSAGELLGLVRDARDLQRRRNAANSLPPSPPQPCPPSRGFQLCRDAYVDAARQAGADPEHIALRAQQFDRLAARHAPAAELAGLVDSRKDHR